MGLYEVPLFFLFMHQNHLFSLSGNVFLGCLLFLTLEEYTDAHSISAHNVQ